MGKILFVCGYMLAAWSYPIIIIGLIIGLVYGFWWVCLAGAAMFTVGSLGKATGLHIALAGQRFTDSRSSASRVP